MVLMPARALSLVVRFPSAVDPFEAAYALSDRAKDRVFRGGGGGGATLERAVAVAKVNLRVSIARREVRIFGSSRAELLILRWRA